jgi:hypothetical protein
MSRGFFDEIKDHKCQDTGTVNAECVPSQGEFCTPVQCLGPA